MYQINDILTECSNTFSLDIDKINAYNNAVITEYFINCKEAELKVINESGTDADLRYLLEANENSLIERLGEGVRKILEAIGKFFKSIYDKFKSIFTKNEKKLEDAQAALKQDPQAANTKIDLPDIQAADKAYAEYMSATDKMIAKITAGGKVSADEADKAKKTFLEKHSKAVKIGAVTLSAVAALGLAIAIGKKNPQLISNASKGMKSIGDKILGFFKKNPTLNQDSVTPNAILQDKAQAEKLHQQEQIKFYQKAINGVSAAIKSGNASSKDMAAAMMAQGKVNSTKYGNASSKEMANAMIAQGKVNNIRYGNASSKDMAAAMMGESVDDYDVNDLFDEMTLNIDFYNAFYEAPADAIENPAEIAGDNSDPSGDAGHATTPTEDTQNESGPDIDDDPWTDVIDDDPEEDLNQYTDNECGNNCGGYGCTTEGYSDKFTEIINDICKCGLGSKPSNESILSSLYGNLGSGNEVEDKGALTKESSVFESILNDIYSLE